jgi:hypothetical protein
MSQHSIGSLPWHPEAAQFPKFEHESMQMPMLFALQRQYPPESVATVSEVVISGCSAPSL